MNDQGNVLMDKFVRQKERVTDYRTRWSGIRPEDVRDHVAHLFEDVQKEAAALFEGRVLVGHAIHNDLKVQSPPTFLCNIILAFPNAAHASIDRDDIPQFTPPYSLSYDRVRAARHGHWSCSPH